MSGFGGRGSGGSSRNVISRRDVIDGAVGRREDLDIFYQPTIFGQEFKSKPIDRCNIFPLKPNWLKISELTARNSNENHQGIEISEYVPIWRLTDGTEGITLKIKLTWQALIGFELNFDSSQRYMRIGNKLIDLPTEINSDPRVKELISVYTDIIPIKLAMSLLLVANDEGWILDITGKGMDADTLRLRIFNVNLSEVEKKVNNIQPEDTQSYLMKLLEAKIQSF